MQKDRVERRERSNLLDKAHDIASGLVFNFRESPGFKRHLFADSSALALGLGFGVGATNIAILLILAAAKISAECFNTSHEIQADAIFGTLEETGYNQEAADSKHSSSAGVGVWVVLSLPFWTWLFVPEFWELIS